MHKILIKTIIAPSWVCCEDQEDMQTRQYCAPWEDGAAALRLPPPSGCSGTKTKRILSITIREKHDFQRRHNSVALLPSHLLWVRICTSNFSSPVNSQAIGHSNLWKDKMYFKLQWLCCYKSKCSFGIWDEKANKMGLEKLMSKKVSVVRCKNFLYLIIKSNFVNEIE